MTECTAWRRSLRGSRCQVVPQRLRGSFAGFAPAAKPKIAFAVLVEHGGHGGAVSAPVAVEIVENYFDTVVPPEERNPPRLSHKSERRLSATSDKPPAPAAPPAEPVTEDSSDPFQETTGVP